MIEEFAHRVHPRAGDAGRFEPLDDLAGRERGEHRLDDRVECRPMFDAQAVGAEALVISQLAATQHVAAKARPLTSVLDAKHE